VTLAVSVPVFPGASVSALEWKGRLTDIDLRALSPLKWQHINPYGTFTLNMLHRLPLQSALAA
jgi:hypothetical protein